MLSQLPTNCFSVTRNMKPQSPSLFLAAALLAKTPRPTYTSTVQIDFLSSFFCGLAESPRLPTLAHQKIPASSLSWAPGSGGSGGEGECTKAPYSPCLSSSSTFLWCAECKHCTIYYTDCAHFSIIPMPRYGRLPPRPPSYVGTVLVSKKGELKYIHGSL